MTTARDFLNLIVLDHQFTHTQIDRPGLAQDLGYIMNLSCSCGWSTGRAVSISEITKSYDTTLTTEWSDREQLQHLLDQELDLRPMLLKLAEGLS